MAELQQYAIPLILAAFGATYVPSLWQWWRSRNATVDVHDAVDALDVLTEYQKTTKCLKLADGIDQCKKHIMTEGEDVATEQG